MGETRSDGATNGFAVASLVLGILWLAGIGAVLAVVFAVVALRRVKRTQAPGSGIAKAGLVIGIIGITIPMALIVAATASHDFEDDGSAAPVGTGSPFDVVEFQDDGGAPVPPNLSSDIALNSDGTFNADGYAARYDPNGSRVEIDGSVLLNDHQVVLLDEAGEQLSLRVLYCGISAGLEGPLVGFAMGKSWRIDLCLPPDTNRYLLVSRTSWTLDLTDTAVLYVHG